jgi:hypothetical protein
VEKRGLKKRCGGDDERKRELHEENQIEGREEREAAFL